MLFALFFVFALISCEDDKEESTKEIKPATAKVEFRNAAQEINADLDKMMNTLPMQSLSYLSDLLDGDWEEKLKVSLFQSGKIHLAKVRDNFRLDASGNRDEIEVGDFGVYTFNFYLDEFQLTETSTTLLKIIYPANEQAYALKQNNAEFLLNNLKYTMITYTETWWDDWDEVWVTETYEEQVPTNAEISLSVDGIIGMSGKYNSVVSENGTPTAVTANLTSAPYQFQMGLSGSGSNYTTSLSLKESNKELMGYNLNITYSSDLIDVQKLSGYYNVSPLKIQGSMNYAAIEERTAKIIDNATSADIDYLNTQLDMELHHTGLNAKLGDIEFRLYVDTDYDESYPELAVVYSDGSYEWLYEVIGEFGDFKRMKQRR
ncbi:hypothetical protein MASR1M74_00740 [Lentimicrobium sp.]